MKHQFGGSSMNNSDEGMGLSVVVYAIAMMCGLALFVLPVVWANSGHVYENPGVTALRTPGGPAYGSHRSEFPLANLKEEQIVSPAMLAELEAKSPTKKEKPTRRASHQPSHRSYAQVQEEPAEQRPARRPFFFSFF
jgi:hypothetical protein